MLTTCTMHGEHSSGTLDPSIRRLKAEFLVKLRHSLSCCWTLLYVEVLSLPSVTVQLAKQCFEKLSSGHFYGSCALCRDH